MCRKTRRRNSRGGFSLIEVALALVVIAIGLTGIMSLVSTGLDSNIKSEHETRAALFAEEALNALRYYATVVPFPAQGVQKEFDLPPPASVFWKNKESLQLFANNVSETGDPNKNVYVWETQGADVMRTISATEYAVRYKLFIGRVSQDIAWIYLQVWGGEYGSLDNPREYYTELFNEQ